MTLLIKLCDDYLHDRLSDEERRAFEERVAKGDKELIETLYQLKAFKKSSPRHVEEEVVEDSTNEEKANLLHLVTEHKKDADSNYNGKERTESSLADAITALEEKKKEKSKTIFFSSLGILLILMIVAVTYQQWNTYLLERKVDLLDKQLTESNKERAELRIKNRDIAFSLDRIKSVVSAEFFVPSKITLKNNYGSWIQLWDRGTLRSIVMLDQPKFEPGEVLQLWSLNARTRDWQLVGSIDKIKDDSLYTIWDAQMLARSIGLQIKLLSKEKKEQVIGETRVK